MPTKDRFGGTVDEAAQPTTDRFGGTVDASATPAVDTTKAVLANGKPNPDLNIPGATPEARRQYIHAHPEAKAANTAGITRDIPPAGAYQGSAGERFLQNVVSPVTGAVGELWDYATDPKAWVERNAQREMGGELSLVPGMSQVGQASTGDVAGALGSGIGQLGTAAALGRMVGPRALNEPGPTLRSPITLGPPAFESSSLIPKALEPFMPTGLRLANRVIKPKGTLSRLQFRSPVTPLPSMEGPIWQGMEPIPRTPDEMTPIQPLVSGTFPSGRGIPTETPASPQTKPPSVSPLRKPSWKKGPEPSSRVTEFRPIEPAGGLPSGRSVPSATPASPQAVAPSSSRTPPAWQNIPGVPPPPPPADPIPPVGGKIPARAINPDTAPLPPSPPWTSARVKAPVETPSVVPAGATPTPSPAAPTLAPVAQASSILPPDYVLPDNAPPHWKAIVQKSGTAGLDRVVAKDTKVVNYIRSQPLDPKMPDGPSIGPEQVKYSTDEQLGNWIKGADKSLHLPGKGAGTSASQARNFAQIRADLYGLMTKWSEHPGGEVRQEMPQQLPPVKP